MVRETEYRRAVARIAKRAGVSCSDVANSYRAAVKKSAASTASLFLLNSVITLGKKKDHHRVTCQVLPTGFTVVRG